MEKKDPGKLKLHFSFSLTLVQPHSDDKENDVSRFFGFAYYKFKGRDINLLLFDFKFYGNISVGL